MMGNRCHGEPPCSAKPPNLVHMARNEPEQDITRSREGEIELVCRVQPPLLPNFLPAGDLPRAGHRGSGHLITPYL